MLRNLSLEAKMLLGIAFFSILILIVAAIFLSKPQEAPAQTVLAEKKANLVASDSHKIATSSAKVTLVEFADFQCPACGASHPVVRRLLADYSANLNFVFRHFPLPQHKNAKMAAQAAEGAGEQGKFFEMTDKLFDSQSSWENLSDPTEVFLTLAKELGLDEVKFKEALGSSKFADRISKDVADGTSLGVNSTPTFFINETLKAGSLSYEEFKKLIDEEHERSNNPSL